MFKESLYEMFRYVKITIHYNGIIEKILLDNSSI